MKLESVRVGMRVKTNRRLSRATGILLAQKYLDARQPDKNGEVRGQVSGHGGDVWWVAHDDGTTGAYAFNEFNPT